MTFEPMRRNFTSVAIFRICKHNFLTNLLLYQASGREVFIDTVVINDRLTPQVEVHNAVLSLLLIITVN